MSRLSVTALHLQGLALVQRWRVADRRGSLARLFSAEELAEAGWTRPIVQLNHTCTAKRGAVRGMHYQRPPHAEMKLVSCIRGKVWDVAVDVRKGSPTFLQWHAEELSAENGHALLIPEGFAHGFQALSDDVELIYCHSAAYRAEAEGGLRSTDPRLAIQWPLQVEELSPRDASHQLVDAAFAGIEL